MDMQIRLWANVTYALVKEQRIEEAIEFFKKEYNGEVKEISTLLAKLFSKISKE